MIKGFIKLNDTPRGHLLDVIMSKCYFDSVDFYTRSAHPVFTNTDMVQADYEFFP